MRKKLTFTCSLIKDDNKSSNEDDVKLDNLKFLVEKSRILLQEQLKSYESAIIKAGIFISISGLLIPILATFISITETLPIIKYLTIIPTFLMIVALAYLLCVLMPKELDHGFDFEQFDNQLENTYEGLLLFEIGANKDSYSDNIKTVNRQNKYLKTGIKFIGGSAILIIIIVIVSLFLI